MRAHYCCLVRLRELEDEQFDGGDSIDTVVAQYEKPWLSPPMYLAVRYNTQVKVHVKAPQVLGLGKDFGTFGRCGEFEKALVFTIYQNLVNRDNESQVKERKLCRGAECEAAIAAARFLLGRRVVSTRKRAAQSVYKRNICLLKATPRRGTPSGGFREWTIQTPRSVPLRRRSLRACLHAGQQE
nr:hypothetical protein CFP56_31731 [Quercus suber]